MNIFYIYHHLRNDSNVPFYVGKGKDNRVRSKKNRNKHWHAIVEMCGYCYEIVAKNLDEELAFLCERELIDKYRRLGFRLANYTDGGEGQSGYKHTEESKRKMRKPRVQKCKTKRALSEEHKAKLSAAKLGKPAPQLGVKLTEDHRKKLSDSHKGLMTNTFWWNNGSVNKRCKICPGSEWVKGRAKRGV